MSRLDKLLKMLDAEPNDAFVLYAIAQEHTSAERHAQAIEFYDRCLAADRSYLYAFYHKAVSQKELGDIAGAQGTLALGLKAAREARDAKAQSEMQTLLDSLG
jgi:tetratricopeptide (TPR) repeat protein